ncbi:MULTISPECIES: hypothetical protein [unclassified Microbispora]|uniref:hypothetical protein n=1 Tax=unclassified Microbispora TaxID=2614687 RepID=UPI00143C50F6|nr:MULTISPECIES: hypothetical protein [unclassified Microbispora]NJP28064.1 hypothetical protein [Microbispora sp. CL1-1]
MTGPVPRRRFDRQWDALLGVPTTPAEQEALDRLMTNARRVLVKLLDGGRQEQRDEQA